jgi:hypothetical protein
VPKLHKFDAENWLYNTRERFDMFYPMGIPNL